MANSVSVLTCTQDTRLSEEIWFSQITQSMGLNNLFTCRWSEIRFNP